MSEKSSIRDGERIAKAMARVGVASRRQAEEMIAAGRVSLNGRVLDSPAINVTLSDQIIIDGALLPLRERTRLWLYHKPRGLVTSARDPEGRPTVFESLPKTLPRVVTIGRLDINTEGLLLLTNDGGLAKVLAHPQTGWLRRYKVRAHGRVDPAALVSLKNGITIDGWDYGSIEAALERVQGDNIWLKLGLREGKNREVKRILEHLGLRVNRLIRLSFGPFSLGESAPGDVQEIKTRHLKEQLGETLAQQAGVDFESPLRDITPHAPPALPEKSRPARKTVPAEAVLTSPYRSRIPRRGKDPRSEREKQASRGYERIGTIKTRSGPVLVERLGKKEVEKKEVTKSRSNTIKPTQKDAAHNTRSVKAFAKTDSEKSPSRKPQKKSR
jgi:23S rRNA pseudouridine2605 synthase